jgi:hypothetical protein
MADKPIPDFLMPTPVKARSIGQDSEILRRMAQTLEQQEDIPDMSNTDTAPRPPLPPAAAPYAPAPRSLPPAPAAPSYSNTVPDQQSVDIQFNGKRLAGRFTLVSQDEANHLIGALTALVPFLPAKGDGQS